jgi:hypothetical protein
MTENYKFKSGKAHFVKEDLEERQQGDLVGFETFALSRRLPAPKPRETIKSKQKKSRFIGKRA